MVKMQMKKPSLIKRILAALSDFFLAFMLFALLFVFAVQPLYNKFSDYQKTVDSYYGEMSKTGLYSYNSKTNICNIIEPEFEEDETPSVESYVNFYEDKIYQYFNSNEKVESYNKLKNDSKLYLPSGDSYVLKEDVTVIEIKDFYVSAIKVAINEIFLQDEDNVKLANKLDNYTLQMVLISMIPSFVIFYFVFPLVFHGGQTLGKRMFNLKIASTETGFEVSKATIIIRQLAIVVIGYIGAYFTFGLSLLAYIVIPFINKKGISIDDFIANTIVYENVEVDEKDNQHILTIVLKGKEKTVQNQTNEEDLKN